MFSLDIFLMTLGGLLFLGLLTSGVSIGVALVASEHIPALLTLVIGSTVFFEIVGPVFTRIAIAKAGQPNGDTK